MKIFTNLLEQCFFWQIYNLLIFKNMSTKDATRQNLEDYVRKTKAWTRKKRECTHQHTVLEKKMDHTEKRIKLVKQT